MKKIIIFALTVVLISVFFVCPVSADDTADISSGDVFSISDFPIISLSTSLENKPAYFYNLYQKFSERSYNNTLYLIPIVKIGGDWCYLSSNNSDMVVNVSLKYNSSTDKITFYHTFSSTDNWNLFARLDFSISEFSWGYEGGLSAKYFHPVSISTGSSLSSSPAPDTVSWIIPDSYYTSTSNSFTLSYFQGKDVQNSEIFDNTFVSSDTISSAEIMTAPQSESDKSDGGHLKVSQSQAANGYTAFSFMLNDNSNYHNYSVKISSNTNQLGTIEQRILNENGGSIDTGSETLSDIASVSDWLNTMFHVWSENIVAMQHFDFEYMFNQNAQTDSALKNLNKSWLSSMCKNMNSLTYSTAKVLTCDELSFTDEKLPYLPCKVVSFALSDYINVNKDTIYKVEIIDNVTQTVLDYTYIATPVAMAKGAENYGIKVYSYKDYETMKNDVLNNDPSNAYTSNTGDKLEDSDPDNGFNSGTIQGIYDEYSINDLSDALSQSVSNATGFVKMCTSLIPPEIMALIVGGIALLVLLRVLGR